MPSIPIRVVTPAQGGRTVTIFMVGTGIVLLLSNGLIKKGIEWLQGKVSGAGIPITQLSVAGGGSGGGGGDGGASGVTNVPPAKPGEAPVNPACKIPDGNFFTNPGGWAKYELCVASGGKMGAD